MKLEQKQIDKVVEILAKMYPEVGSMLNFTTPFELLIATILSAQCTDVRVNKVTSEVFPRYNRPEDFAKLSVEEIENLIKTCGLYKTKAKSIKRASEILLTDYEGVVPSDMKEIMKLPGVGRKTANVVLSNAYGIQGIAVDTHVFRTSNRIGLTNCDNVYDTEMELRRVIPQKKWTDMHHRLINLGRQICKARKPECEKCKLNEFCIHYNRGI